MTLVTLVPVTTVCARPRAGYGDNRTQSHKCHRSERNRRNPPFRPKWPSIRLDHGAALDRLTGAGPTAGVSEGDER